MNMKQRILTAALTSLLLIGTASPAVAKGPEANLKTKDTATIIAGDSAWVALNWEGKGGEVTDFRLTAEAPAGVEVTYPENTPGFTGLMNGHVLSEKELDFTALKVSVPYSQTKKFKIKLLVSYTADGQAIEDNFDVTVKVAEYQANQDIAQVTDSADPIPAGESMWVKVDFTGLAPTIDDFQLVVSDSAGLSVSYPEPRSSTSLRHDSFLEDNETDFAAFRVDAIGVVPGTYNLGLTVSYTKAGFTKNLTGTFTIVVAK